LKLFTKPRPIPLYLLRVGDQVAVHSKFHTPVTDWLAFIDLDLSGKLAWAGVADTLALSPEALAKRLGQDRNTDQGRVTEPMVLLVHHLGDVVMPRTTTLITREAIEFDPLTYVKRADGDTD